MSAPFQIDIKFLFEGFDFDIKNCKGFENPIRSMLVDNILKNMTFDTSSENQNHVYKDVLLNVIETVAIKNKSLPYNVKKLVESFIPKTIAKRSEEDIEEDQPVKNVTYTGLSHMIEKGYFEDAFILHRESEKYQNEFLLHAMKTGQIDNPDTLELLEKKKNQSLELDRRLELSKQWASFKNVLKTQPLLNVRSYFGEMIAFYFSFCGTVISSLWIPVLIGIVFFIVGIIQR